MVIGIVGCEEKKFTSATEQEARMLIRDLLRFYDKATSGGCHLGGIDIWAKEEALKMNRPFVEYLPKEKSWAGYKNRNILIAKNSDVVVCITVKSLPPDFKPMGWEKYCYHCGTDQHIKSGGCWTVKYAQKLGKEGKVIVIGDTDDRKANQV